MSVLHKANTLLEVLRRQGVRSGLRLAGWKLRAAAAENDHTWNLCFRLNPLVKTGAVEDYSQSEPAVWQELRKLSGLQTREFEIDPEGFRAYAARAKYEEFDPYYRGGMSGDANHRTEKLLQHYLSLELLGIGPDDTYIDVASNTSPMRHIVKRLYQIPTYSLDMRYPAGVQGDLIGADAGAMPLSDGFVSKMTLHCSFEHFAFGADSRFIRECARVLRPGGKVCVIPLYVLPNYCVRVDPTIEGDISVSDTEGADKVYVRGYRVDYGRFYSPSSFRDRVLAHASGLSVTIVHILGLEKLRPENVYSHFALLIEKPSTPGIR